MRCYLICSHTISKQFYFILSKLIFSFASYFKIMLNTCSVHVTWFTLSRMTKVHVTVVCNSVLYISVSILRQFCRSTSTLIIYGTIAIGLFLLPGNAQSSIVCTSDHDKNVYQSKWVGMFRWMVPIFVQNGPDAIRVQQGILQREWSIY